jgi:hypothetical protein
MAGSAAAAAALALLLLLPLPVLLELPCCAWPVSSEML